MIEFTNKINEGLALTTIKWSCEVQYIKINI